MSWLARITNVFRSDRLNEDLDDEQRFHIEARALQSRPRGRARSSGFPSGR